VTAYAGTPDYLKVILDKAEEMGVELKIGQGGGGRRRAVPVAAAGLRRSRDRLPAVLCHRRSGQHRL
jgi:hypothetical protein